MIRAVILSATIAALVTFWMDQPAPVKDNQEPYCPIDERAAVTHPMTGETVIVWVKRYGPCRLMDRYEFI